MFNGMPGKNSVGLKKALGFIPQIGAMKKIRLG
jgi:hypothetical protein